MCVFQPVSSFIGLITRSLSGKSYTGKFLLFRLQAFSLEQMEPISLDADFRIAGTIAMGVRDLYGKNLTAVDKKQGPIHLQLGDAGIHHECKHI